MPSEQEKSTFARRLHMALHQWMWKQRALYPNIRSVHGATELARQFNLRHAGHDSVFPQAAHQWLSGRVIPKADKLKTLAEWLGVSEHWLHDGPPPKPSKEKVDRLTGSSLQTLALARQIEALPEHLRYFIREIVTQFYGGLSTDE